LILKYFRDLGDRESANIIKLEAEEHRAAFLKLNIYKKIVFSPGVLSDFGEFLAREYSDLSGKNLLLTVGNF
jgi:hypothetical protein